VTGKAPVRVDPVSAAFARLPAILHAPQEAGHPVSRSVRVIGPLCYGLLALALLAFAAAVVVALGGFDQAP
jgi:hypothetical protein